ncbi:MAG: MFS transporter, partial [Bradyrhizobium sp.]
RLVAGDMTTAKAIGLDRIPPDVSAVDSVIQQAAFATSANEAWALLAAVALFGLLLIFFVKRHPADGSRG